MTDATLIAMIGTLAYVVGHFLAYVVVFREWAPFRQERWIFLYHFVSFLMAILAALAAAAVTGQVAALVGAAAVHGIYSLSFLELWSLAQGGFSLSILDRLKNQDAEGLIRVLAELEAIGARKNQDRTSGLALLGLIRRSSGDRLELTFMGHVVSSVLAGLTWTVHGPRPKP
ncbi:hypothetical protein [Skermanella aerolata]|nr:hypothetical protein [Skermanella aerolata]